jgi:hypothetical protein
MTDDRMAGRYDFGQIGFATAISAGSVVTIRPSCHPVRRILMGIPSPITALQPACRRAGSRVMRFRSVVTPALYHLAAAE